MAIFKKNEPQAQKPRDRPSAPLRGAPTDGAISIIGNGMSVIGDISTEGIVRVEGQVRGTIRAGKAVILGQAGMIEGNIFTDDAVIGGTVHGSIVAENRLEMQSTCSVEGEIHTRPEHLKLEEGARFAGQVHMLESAQATEAEPASPYQAPTLAPVYPADAQDRGENAGMADSPQHEGGPEEFDGEGGEGEEGEPQRRKKA